MLCYLWIGYRCLDALDRYLEKNMDSDDDLEELPDIDDNDNVERVQRRYIRDGINPFEYYNDDEFKRRYRFDKDSVRFGILPQIEEGLARANNRGLPIPPVMQLLICLRYYATASFQVFIIKLINLYLLAEFI